MALKNGFPDCHITWVVDPRFAGIVECCASVDEVVKFKPSAKTIPTYSDRFDAALDLQGLLKSALGIVRAKADRKVGYHWQREGANFFSQRILPDPTSFHVVDQYVDVARSVGGQMDRAEFQLFPKDDDLKSVKAKLAHRISGPFVAVNAGAGWASKRWTPSSFASVIDGLFANNIAAVLIGGKADSDLQAAQEVIQACSNPPINLLGETTVRELVALLSLCDAHLGGDTGSTHLAAALGKPAIGLYSITRPQRSCPYGQIERCHYHPDGLAKIDHAQVLKSVLEAIH